MRKMSIVVLMFISSIAGAELKMAQKPLPLYLDSSGRQVNPVEAIKKSISGEKILKCEVVEAQASATGNVSLKKVK